MLFIKGIYLLLSHLPTFPTFGGCLTHRPPSSSDCANGAIHRHRRKTAEERFNMLARGWLAYPVTPIHSLLPPKSGCIRQHMVGLHSLVAERRHSSVTRYAKRSVACRDSPRHQPLRAGGTPLPHLRRLPHHIVRHPSDCANGAIHRHRRKTAEERFNMLARGWLAYPVTPTHHPSTAEERLYKVIPSVCLPRDALRHTQRAEPPFPGSPALRLNQLLFSYSITFCALPSTTTT